MDTIQNPENTTVKDALESVEELAKSFNQLLDNPPTEGYSKTDVILIRHGYSEYNFQSDRFKNETNLNIHSEEARLLRLNIGDIDTPLHQIGLTQAQNSQKYINDLDIDTVFVSPLLRTLQTTEALFASHPNKQSIKFIVLPELAEGLCFSCSFAPLAFSENRQKQFPTYDFSHGQRFTKKALWQMEQLACPQAMSNAMEKFSGTDNEEELSKIFLSELDRLFPSYIETHEHLWQRAQQARKFIEDYKKKNLAPGKKILIVAHFVLLLFLTSSEKKEDFHDMDGIKCKNSKLIPWEI